MRELLRGAGVMALAGGLLAVLAVRGLERLAGPVVPRIEGLLVDAAFRVRHRFGVRPPVDPRVAPVRIGQESIDRYGRWPWPRSVHARMLERAAEGLAPRGVVYDILFRGKSAPEEDAAFARALREVGGVGLAVGVHTTALRDRRLRRKRLFGDPEAVAETLPPPHPGYPAAREWVETMQAPLDRFTRAAAGVGHIQARPDADGVYRRLWPFLVLDDRLLPSLSVLGACLALDIPVEEVRVEDGDLVFPAMGELSHERRLPLGPDGSLIINWAGPYGEAFRPLRAFELEHEPDPDLLARGADKLLVVGLAGLELDQGPSPLDDFEIPLFQGHLHAINSMLTGAAVREERGVLWGLALVLLGAAMLYPIGRTKPLPAAVLAALPPLAYVSGGLALFALRSTLVPFALPLLSGGGAYLGLLGHLVFVQHTERERARESFSRYFSPEVVARVMDDPQGPRLGGKRCELTVLFSDIQGFTTTSERIDPDVLGEFLGEYFERMVELVFRSRGTVDKFMGDGLMAFWGDPVPLEDHALRAVEAARAMQLAAERLSDRWEDRLGGPFRIRVGINTGVMTVGNMGGERRMDYTVMGRAVNLAQRLEANADPGGILVGERTRRLLPEWCAVGEERSIRAKGIEGEVRCFVIPVRAAGEDPGEAQGEASSSSAGESSALQS